MIASPPMQRGNMIPEMALVLSLVMMMLFGVMQYALVGFNQIGTDGAAFVGDHAAVAYYSSPTTANATYAQQVGLSDFPQTGASSYTASIPKNGAYEMDLKGTTPSIGGLANLFPSTVSSRSRIVEPSQSSANMNTLPGECANAVESVTYGTTSTILNNPAVALVGNIPTDSLYQTVQTTSGTQLELNLPLLNGPLSEPAQLQTAATEFKSVVQQLQTIGTALNALPLGIGASLSTNISTQIAPLLASATGGTYTVNGTISVTTPLTSAQFTAQETVATKAIQNIESSTLGGTLVSTLAKVLDPILYGTTGTGGVTGLLGGPSGGLLDALNNTQNALYAFNQKAKACTTY
jgi:hypothetical protein